MNDPEQDEVFEAFLKRRSVLPNALDDRLEPPAALDDIVLRKARDAIKARAAPDPVKQQMYHAPRWAMPVALAATVLLCLSVVLNISLNTNRPTPNIQRMAAARDEANAGAKTDALSGGRTASDAERRKSVSGDVPAHEVILPEAKVAGSPAPRAPVVAESALDSPPPADEIASSRGPTLPTASAPSAASDAPSAAAESMVASAAPAALPRSAADKAELFAKRSGASAPGSPPSAARASNAVAPSEAAPHPADPKAWLQQIDALRAAGKTSQADAEMQRFRVIFPGYVAKPTPPTASDPSK